MGKTVENYMLNQLLGQGTYAKVFKGKHIITGQQFAIKVISAQKFRDIPKLQQCTVNEINILTQLRGQSQYIVNYIDMLKTPNNFYFVYDYCNGGTLDKIIQKQGSLPEQKAVIYLRQIVQAFKILNRHNIMHRDLKPENILIHNGNIKIADFSFCKLLQEKTGLTRTMLGSPIYMAPEVLKGESYTSKTDVWSMGIVFYRMLFGKCPYQSKSIALLIKLLQKQELELPNQPKLSSITQQFLRRVIVKDPNHRISWDQIFNTYIFTDNGHILRKDQMMQQQVQLRASIKAPVNGNNMNNGYGGGLRVSLPVHTSLNNLNGPINQMNNYNPNMMMLSSPKSGLQLQSLNNSNAVQYNRTPESQQAAMERSMGYKKSPLKNQQQRIMIDQNAQKNIQNYNNMNFPQRGNFQQPSYLNSQQNIPTNPDINKGLFQVQPQYPRSNGKNQRTGQLSRTQIFTKHHLRFTQINQIIIQIFALSQQYANYICYFLFKNACKQIEGLYQNLKKESIQDPIIRQFRVIVESEIANLPKITSCFQQAIMQQQKQQKILGDFSGSRTLDQHLLQNKQKIMKLYVQKLLIDSDDDIRLASQVVDYLQQNFLLKRDAYQRMSRDHLYKQMKNKIKE